jgi:hypothetical protein
MAEKESNERAEPQTIGDVRNMILDSANEPEPGDVEDEGAAEETKGKPDGAEPVAEAKPESKAPAAAAGSDEDGKATSKEGSETASGESADDSSGKPESEGKTPAEAALPADQGTVATPGESAAKEPKPDDSRVLLEVSKDKRFTVEDLADDAKRSEFKKELREGYLRTADYTNKTKEVAEERRRVEQDAEHVRRAHAELERRGAVLADLVAVEDMAKLIGQFGNTKLGAQTLIQRLTSNPDQARAIAASPEALEKLWDQMEFVKNNPAHAAQLAEAEEARLRNAQTEEEIQRFHEGQALRYTAVALGQTIEQMAAEYEGVDSDEVEEIVLAMGGLKPEMLADVDNQPESVQRQVIEGLRTLARVFLYKDESGSGAIRPDVIRQTYSRLHAARKAAGPGETNGQPARDPATGKFVPADKAAQKAEEHNATVKSLLEESPPVPPKGGAPGALGSDENPIKADNYKDFRKQIV